MANRQFYQMDLLSDPFDPSTFYLPVSDRASTDGTGYLSFDDLVDSLVSEYDLLTGTGTAGQLAAFSAAGVLGVVPVKNANKIYAGPTTGADATPAFRLLVSTDIPDLSSLYITPTDLTAALAAYLTIADAMTGYQPLDAALTDLADNDHLNSLTVDALEVDQIVVVSGTDKSIGKSTLVGGTVTVPNTRASATMHVQHSRQAAGGTLGNLSIANVVNGVSFDIVSDNALDTSDVAWLIIEPS